LRHEILSFSLQFSAKIINLAQNRQLFYDNQAHKVNLPKMGKCFATIVGQSNWSALLLTFMSHIRPIPSPQGVGQECSAKERGVGKTFPQQMKRKTAPNSSNKVNIRLQKFPRLIFLFHW